MNYYLISLRKDNFKQLKENGFSLVGLPAYSRIVESIRPGDKIVLYVGKPISGIPGIIEATSEMYYSDSWLWDEFFPKRINATPYKMIDDSFVPMRDIKNGLSFVRPEIKKFGVYFMQGIRKLSDSDYAYLEEKVGEMSNEA